MPDAPRFCPFCRESFDGVESCPDHGLPLVPFEELPGLRRPVPEEDDPVAPYDLRFGRGWVLLGAAMISVGAVLPMVARDGVGASLVQLATTRATNLWTIPCVTAAQVAIVLRRRTLVAMRAARAAIPALSLLAAASLFYTLHRVAEGAAELRGATGLAVEVRWEAGTWVVLGGTLLAGVGGSALGRVRA